MALKYWKPRSAGDLLCCHLPIPIVWCLAVYPWSTWNFVELWGPSQKPHRHRVNIRLTNPANATPSAGAAGSGEVPAWLHSVKLLSFDMYLIMTTYSLLSFWKREGSIWEIQNLVPTTSSLESCPLNPAQKLPQDHGNWNVEGWLVLQEVFYS